jgi:hypothetical protein
MAHPPGADIYQVVVARRGHASWEWEILRNGQPLPIRLRNGNFRSERAAVAAGKVAFRELLVALAREQNP